MVLPESDQAAKKVWTTEQRAVGDRCSANDDVAATSGGLEFTIPCEFADGKAVVEGLFVEEGVDGLELVPIFRGRQVDFEDSGIGSDAEVQYARVGRRCVTFEPDRHLEMPAGIFDGGDDVEIIGEHGEEWKEDMEATLPDFDAQGRTDENRRVLRFARDGGQRIGRRFALEELGVVCRRLQLCLVGERRVVHFVNEFVGRDPGPMGESPAISTRRSGRGNQSWLDHARSPLGWRRRMGRTNP